MKHIEILNADGSVTNVIVADEAFAQQQHPGAWRVAAVQPVQEPAPELRHITVGAFFDRFGAAKWDILADPAPAVQAVVRDASVRRHIDLDNPDLPAGLAVVQAAGHAIDPQAIIGAPVQPQERP